MYMFLLTVHAWMLIRMHAFKRVSLHILTLHMRAYIPSSLHPSLPAYHQNQPVIVPWLLNDDKKYVHTVWLPVVKCEGLKKLKTRKKYGDLTVRYHCGGWPEEVNSCFLNSYMVYL